MIYFEIGAVILVLGIHMAGAFVLVEFLTVPWPSEWE